MTYTGGTTGKPKGVIGTVQTTSTMTTTQLAEWEWPEHPRFLMCTPLSHAGAAFFVPTIVKGGELIVLTKFDPAEVLRVIEEQKHHGDHVGAVDAVRPDGSPGLTHP